jgi:anti-anti-sigma factor
VSASDQHPVQPSVHLLRNDATAVVVLRGEVDISLRHELQVTLAEAVRADRVIVDLGAATFIDSTTINALVVANRAARLAGVGLALTPGPRGVMRALELGGLADFFEITVDPNGSPPGGAPGRG